MRPAYSQFWVAIAAVLTLAAPKGAATQLDQVAGTEVDLAIGIEPRLISSTPSIFTNDDADTLLARATSRLAMKNDHSACSDFTVCLNLVPSSHVELPADLPDILVFNDDDEAGAWLSQHFNPAIKVVGAISIKNSPVEGFSNGGASPSMVIAVFSSSTSSLRVTASTWAHEFCHTAGLAEVTGDSYCDYNIMKDQSSQRDPDQLTLTQVTTMESNVPSMPVAKAATVECQPTSVAGLENIRARLGPDGVVVSFGTIWEAYTAAFEIQRMDAESGAILYSLGTASEIPSQAERSYAALDRNGGSGCVYRIVEHQTDGRGDLYHGPVFAEPAPALLPVGTSPYAVDSLAAVVLSYDRGPSDPPPSPCSNHDLLNGTPEYELLCPDSFVTPLNSYASLWRQRGVYTWVVSKTIADSCAGGFREWIRYAASKGTRYFLLVGDANDHVMWDEPANWRMGWRFPGVYNSPSQTTLITHTPSQPNKDIIPTFYQAVVDSPQYAWTYYTPYFASDLPYTDADDDGLPDVIVGRLPASSVAEVTAYTGKLAGWLSSTGGTLGATAALFTYAVNHGRTPAWPTAFAVDALRPAMVAQVCFRQGISTSGDRHGDRLSGTAFRLSLMRLLREAPI